MNEVLREKYSALDGETEVKYTFDGNTIIARKEGMIMNTGGLRFETEMDLQKFAKIMTDAWKDHKKLKVKIEIAKVLPV